MCDIAEAIRTGALAALEKRRDRLKADYRQRNSVALMNGKTPEEEAIYESNKAHFDAAIEDVRKMTL